MQDGGLEVLQLEFVHGASVAAREEHRQRWGSRRDFLLVCAGGVIGIGNLWRFPALCYEFGGAACAA